MESDNLGGFSEDRYMSLRNKLLTQTEKSRATRVYYKAKRGGKAIELRAEHKNIIEEVLGSEVKLSPHQVHHIYAKTAKMREEFFSSRPSRLKRS